MIVYLALFALVFSVHVRADTLDHPTLIAPTVTDGMLLKQTTDRLFLQWNVPGTHNILGLIGQGYGTTSLHVNPGYYPYTPGPIVEIVAERTADQVTNFGRCSFAIHGADTGNIDGINCEYGGTVIPQPFTFLMTYKYANGTFDIQEPMRFNRWGNAINSAAGTTSLGVDYPDARNVLNLNMGNCDNTCIRDSHAILWEGKSHDGTTHRAVWWRLFVDITDSVGTSWFTLQSTKSDGAGWGDKWKISDTGLMRLPSVPVNCNVLGTDNGGNVVCKQ